MAEITITAASVAQVAGVVNTIEQGTAGATVTAGQAVYKEAATGLLKLSDADSATAEARAFYGLALHGSMSGQPLSVLKAGRITIGGTVAPGTFYVVGSTAGAVNPAADLTTGWGVAKIGIGVSATVIEVQPQNTSVVL